MLSDELSVRGQPLGHAHFPIDGFISMVIDMDNYPELEVGMVGCESMLGAELLLGVTPAPWRALVQGPGHSWRIGAKALRRECATSPALLQAVQTSLLVRLHQQALASACERFHMIGQRLARWLLMSQDRAQSDCFHVTHEGMATMLGVRRVGVTLAASELQDSGLIRYHRGELTVLDRTALEGRVLAVVTRPTGRCTGRCFLHSPPEGRRQRPVQPSQLSSALAAHSSSCRSASSLAMP